MAARLTSKKKPGIAKASATKRKAKKSTKVRSGVKKSAKRSVAKKSTKGRAGIKAKAGAKRK